MVLASSLLSLVALGALASACPATIADNTDNLVVGEKVTHEALCLPQGADSWTFGLYVMEASWTGTAEWFLIMDHNCILKGLFQRGDCNDKYGWDMKVDEMPHYIVVNNVYLSPSAPSAGFDYAGKRDVIGDNCREMDWVGGGQITVETGCKKAFQPF